MIGAVHPLFVYGTLRHPPLIEGLVGGPVDAHPATLAGHRAAVLRGRAYPGLVVDPQAVAVGSLVVLDDAGLRVLDDFEGPEYERTDVVVRLEDDSTAPAQTYLLTGPSRSLVRPGAWDLDRFVAGAATDWVRAATPGTHHPH